MRIACLALLCACSSAAHPTPSRPDDVVDSFDRESRIFVAQLEARRGDGVDQLIDLVKTGKTHERQLALRGLGRIGGPRALAAIRLSLDQPEIATAAAQAIGLAASLDDPHPEDVAALIASHADRDAQLEALGRVAQGPIPTITDALHDDATAEAAALACGRLGRRKLALDAPTRARLVALTRHKQRAIRYAAGYALSREVVGDPDPLVTDALLALVADGDPEIRAVAIAGLVKHKAAARVPAETLLDRDWRVAVEAVRARIDVDDAARDGIAAALVRRLAELPAHPTEAQVITEGERALQKYADRPLVQSAASALARSTVPWVACLADELLARAQHSLAPFAACTLPEPILLPLIAESEAGTLAERRDLLGKLLASNELRVRISSLSMFAALWKESDARDHHAGVAVVASALGSQDRALAGAAVEAAGPLHALADADDRTMLEAAIVIRATTESDPELESSLLDLIAEKKLSAGVVACRGAIEGQPVVSRAAVKCLSALGEAAVRSSPAVAPAQAPPVDVASVIGKRLDWHLTTDRGEVVIALSPDAAPWAVASIVALTRRGFYDGLELHRVVPNFVVQGGDPTQTGSGGPGYLLPAEPSAGAGFQVGGVGMADAGRDSGGSQYFAMHGRAPHLDGRYTWVGVVTAGQEIADSLLIGDRVKKAVIVPR